MITRFLLAVACLLTFERAVERVFGAEGEETLVLTPSLDTSIVSSGTNPKGNATILSGTRHIGTLDRGLLRFDFSGLPAEAMIESVELRLRVVMVPGAPAASEFGLYRMLTDWNAAANWTIGKLGVAWGADGGLKGEDYAEGASARTQVDKLGEYVFGPTEELLNDVQMWVADPGANKGWFLITDDEGVLSTARHFGSSESDQPPQLIVHYKLAEQGLMLGEVGVKDGQFGFSFEGSPGQVYQVQTRGNLETANWSALTNVTVQVAGPVAIATPVEGDRGFYRVVVE